jgi:general secretion pathway protein H
MEHGFSLIEMLLVLVILALVSSLFVPTLRHGGRDKTPAAMAYELQAVFLKARANAISRGVTESIQLDLTEKEVTYSGAEQAIRIPESLQANLLVGRQLLVTDGAATLLFFPDGGSSGVKVTFTDQKRNVAGVVVSWLTGTPVVLREK